MTMQAVRSGVTTPDGVRLHLETTGSDDAPVTVLLSHGWTCSTRSWHHQFEDLPRILGASAVRVVAYDHRGHGRSEDAPPGTTWIEQLAADLVTVLEAVVPTGPVVYAGHSMGGMTLLALAEQRPELFSDRIAAAALVSTSSGRTASRPFGLPERLDDAAALVAPRAMNLAGQRVERRALRQAARTSPGSAPAPGAEEVAASALVAARLRMTARVAGWSELAGVRLQRPAVRQLVFGANPDPTEVDILMADLAATPGRSLSGFFEAITQHEREEALKVLRALPVEVMHGTRDRLLPPRHANRLAELLPEARLWMYPRAGHMLMQERPRDVTQRIAGLARHVTRTH